MMKYTDAERRKIKREEAIRVYESDNYLIVIPLTYKAACIYGAGTTWCIVSSDEYLFEAYSPETNPLFIIICKGAYYNCYWTKKRYQYKFLLQFETEGLVDAETNSISYQSFFEEAEELRSVFEQFILEDTYKEYSTFEKGYFLGEIRRELLHTPWCEGWE